MRIRHEAFDAILKRHIVGADVAPGATACVALATGAGWTYWLGAAGIRSAQQPDRVTVDSIYDLASVTKPFVAVTVARLHERARLSLDDTLEHRVPWLSGTFGAGATLESLLAHRAGLLAHLELFREPKPDRRGRARLAANGAGQGCELPAPREGFAPTYSDLGYLLIGHALEHTLGRDLDEIVGRELAAAGIDDVASARRFELAAAEGARSFRQRVVPTEQVPQRGGEVHGAVHDDNAWAETGYGLSGHAGLFGTAYAVARFGVSLLDTLREGSPLMGRHTLERLLRPRPGATLLAGFDGKSASDSSAGTLMGARAFGHLGFTGTSLWCDPEGQQVVVLLCNRVSPTRANSRIRAARPLVADALLRAAAEWQG